MASLVVDSGPAGTVNLPFVSLTVCAPGTANCQTIDHILVDTGSTGLRLVSGAVPAGFTLPAANTPAGAPMYECEAFADGYTWGSVRLADVKIADGMASSIPIHLIGDPSIPAGASAAPAVPTDCPNAGPPENTVTAFGANGVLGLNVWREDCGPACVSVAAPGGQGAYYACPAGACTGTTVALASQLQNPVYWFGTNNNGVLIEMASIPATGQVAATGSLVLGIDTQANNALGSHTLLTLDSSGSFTTRYKGTTLSLSFIDSGSNGYYFDDTSLPACTQISGFYCPATLTALTASNTGANGASSTVAFSIANADTLTKNTTFAALPNIGGSTTLTGSFDFGLPFFYGRSVYVGFEGRTASSGSGPFVAY